MATDDPRAIARACNRAGCTAAAAGDYAAAVRAFDVAVRADPAAPDPLNNRGTRRRC